MKISDLPKKFWVEPAIATIRVEKDDLKELLLINEPLIALGCIWDIQWKHIGLGVYEIWFERRTYAE